jgi:hypothetical protein
MVDEGVMEKVLFRLLRGSAGAFLLALAWAHFFWGAPYRAALEAHADLAGRVGIHPDAGDRMAIGLGICFFLTGLFAVIWRPPWLGRGLVLFSVIPVMGSLVAEVASAELSHAGAVLATRFWGPGAVLALALFREGRQGLVRFILRLGLTAVFGFWAIRALGWAGEVPAEWLGMVRSGWMGRGEMTHLQLLAVLTLGGCVGLWIRPILPASAIILGLAGVAAVVAPVVLHLDSGAFAVWHQRLPEAIGRIGLVLLPAAAAFTLGSVPQAPPPRRLKRVELPIEPDLPV